MSGLQFLLICVCLHLSFMLVSAEFEQLSFRLVFGPSPKDNEQIFLTNWTGLLQSPKFDLQRKTVFYIFGWCNKFSDTYDIAAAHLSRNDHNFVVIDWADYSYGNYVLEIGDLIGSVFVNFFKNGMSDRNVHLVGHSLGAHIAGFIGKYIQLVSSNKIQRITALDPAAPGFVETNIFDFIKPFLNESLSKNDARFIDVIHVSFSGIQTSIGTADFFPNGGIFQNGCVMDVFQIIKMSLELLMKFTASANQLKYSGECNHNRGYEYWAESVRNKKTFNSVACASLESFKANQCGTAANVAYMGYDVDESVSGNFYLQTNPRSNYARGQNGISYI